MNITESKLRSLIEEEIFAMIESGEIDEGFLTRQTGRLAGFGTAAAATAKGLAQRGIAAAQKATGDVAGTAQTTTQRQAGAAQSKEMVKKARAGQVIGNQVGNLRKNIKEMESDARSLGVSEAPAMKKAIQSLKDSILVLQQIHAVVTTKGSAEAADTPGQ